ncbi:hypothetical protein ACR79N_02110 [Sphingobacterium siyangense]|uniref:hypothetical protein n=1 Tax=Sphingobacterium siyangense TaxID=459529 RepID=UPI003DA3C528
MSTNNNSNGGNIGYPALLTPVFIVLKLIDKIDWSWWWVLAPVWIPIAFMIVVRIIEEIIRQNRINRLR